MTVFAQTLFQLFQTDSKSLHLRVKGGEKRKYRVCALLIDKFETRHEIT